MPTKKPEKKVVEKTVLKNEVTTKSKKTNTIAIIAIVITIIFFWAPIVGLILGIIALLQIKKNKESGKGIAIVSIVLSSIFLILQVALIAFMVFGAKYLGSTVAGKNTINLAQDGNSISIGNASLPSTFPKDVPIYPGSKATVAVMTKDNDYGATLTTEDSVEKVNSYYKGELFKLGWTPDDTQSDPSNSTEPTTVYKKESATLSIITITDKKSSKTNIIIAYKKNQ